MMIRVEEYLDEEGESPFRHWFLGLDAKTAAKVTVRLERMATGNFADYKGVGGGVLESRIHFGPGYRIYFGKDGEDIVILLAGGSKRRQGNDIKFAISLWNDFRMRKKEARK
jgi:putative addiction module killer protein